MKNPATVASSIVAAIALVFALYQYVERRATENGERQAVLKRITEQTDRMDQLMGDLRARVADLERATRFIHGELTLK